MTFLTRRLFGRAALPLALAAALAVAACSSTPKEEDIVIEGSVEDLYNRATDLLEADKYKEAARFYNEVDRQHPYSTWASRAQLMAAFSYYKDREYETAISALNRFIRLHPSHRDIAYAYYLKALCYFEQVRDVKRDQTPSEEALKAFDEVVKRFPDSRYAQDSRNKIILVQDHLAGHEMDVGRWYQRNGRFIAAVNRYKVVVDKFQTSRQVPEALHRMTESYTALGLTDEARRVAAVLGHNYPSSEWYFDTYELVEKRPVERPPAAPDTRSWIRRQADWLF
ncbi:MAG: outer membrane protein assembly factor BamD [Alphaproteobacteria bacterium]